MLIGSLDHCDFSEEMRRCRDYIQALEEERRKIQVFRRELPLCLELVTQAIEACKHQISGTTTECNLREQSECSEQTSSPVFEEFIPLKRVSSHSEDEEQESHEPMNGGCGSCKDEKNGVEKGCKKSDWLRSVHLWNQTPDPSSEVRSPRKVAVMEVKRSYGAGAFHPFKTQKNERTGGTFINPTPALINGSAPPASASSTEETGGGNKKEEKEGESCPRKVRRCWSPELHRRFVQALQHLGGSNAATPKQIRELMKVDGLTNDEVKSHLQKYRLHMRRPASTQNSSSAQTPQFVVVGGIWVPPEYAAAVTADAAAATPTSDGIYAPVVALPPDFPETSTSPKQRHSQTEDGVSHSEGVQCHSPATSSSTHVPASSPAY